MRNPRELTRILAKHLIGARRGAVGLQRFITTASERQRFYCGPSDLASDGSGHSCFFTCRV